MRISWSNGYKDIQPTDDSYRLRRIMGENKVTLRFSLPDFTEFPLGSFINYQGQRYTLNAPQKINEVNSTHFEYTLVFGSSQDLLANYKIKDTQGRLKFPLTATPREHLQVLINTLNVNNSGWSIGNCIENTEKLISYNHTNCYEALQMIANEFKTEWEVVGKVIHLRKVEYNKTNPLALSYGKGNGFVSGVGRNNDDQKAGFNVLYVQGGERNIDRSKYGSKELLLPKSKEYTYEGITYVTDANGLSITQKGVAINNRKEESLDCSHIYPQRVGTVSEVIEVDTEKHFYDFKDSSIPTDLDFSQCRMNGEKITIQFNSGMLSGREFEIQQEEDSMSGYVHAERRFKLVPKKEDGYTMPNDTFKPAVGDKYAVFGMMMPNAYISDDATKTGASWEMFKEACKHFYENHQSEFTFKGTLDGIWAKNDWVNIGGKIKTGGFISFSDSKFQPQGINIRIVSVKDYINNPHSPIIELANSVQGGGVSSELDKIKQDEVVREDLYKRSLDFTKRRFRDAQETIKMLEKAQLNFGKGINPATVQTMSLLVGDKSLQFRFVKAVTNPVAVDQIFTYNKTTKKFSTTAGIVQHLTLGIDALKTNQNYKFWNVTAFESAVLDVATKSYYLYIKASKTNQTATFVLSETAIKLEEVAGYYHLLTGILNSESDSERSFVRMYGFTEILPGQIKVDKITSGNGLHFIKMFDDKIQINGNIQFTNDSPAVRQVTAHTSHAYLNTLMAEKINVEQKYQQIYADTQIAASVRTNVTGKRNLYNYAYGQLEVAILDAVRDGQVTDAERINIDNKYVLYRQALGNLRIEFEKALKNKVAVAQNQATAVGNAAQNTANSAISKAEQAKIDAQNAETNAKNELAKKIGYTSFNDLEAKASLGKTIISGGLINTILINAKAVISKYLQAELLIADKIMSNNNGIRVNINANNSIPFEVFNSLGTKQLELKEENGSIQFVFRNKSGKIIWYMGEEGFKHAQFTAESWKQVKLKYLGTTKSFTNNSFGITGVFKSPSGGYYDSNQYIEVGKATNGTYFYDYVSATNAGTLLKPNEHGNTYKSQNYASYNKIDNGYYYNCENAMVMEAMTDSDRGSNAVGNPVPMPGDVVRGSMTYDRWYAIMVYKFENGKITEQFNYIF